MIDIGIVGLDTSHAEGFADCLMARDDAELQGVWDGGDVRDAKFVESFCETYDTTEHTDFDAMIPEIDAAMVLTVDWTTHRPLATAFLEQNIPTLIDKPIAGSISDIRKIEAVADGTPLFGGSAVPYHDDFDALPRGGTERTLYAASYNDFFYYRVHLVDTVRHLVDSNWKRVDHGPEPGTTMDIHFENGAYATIRFDGPPEGGTFSVLDIGDTTQTVEVENSKETLGNMYDSFISAFVATVIGERDERKRVVDSARLALAVESAIEHECPIYPDSDELQTIDVHGADFLSDYSPFY